MKIAILITARLKSARLPLKVIKPIHGRPMIIHMLNRLKLAKKPQEIIICTSTLEQDDPLVKIAEEEGVKCFRGHPDDVLLRLTNAAKEHDVDLVINCTADNPFVDPEYIDYLVDYHIKSANEFSKIEGLPWGTFSYAINPSAMERACSIKDEVDTEVWHGYFMDTGLFKWGALLVNDPEVVWPELRLTVDTSEDFQLITRIFDELYDGEKVFPLRDIISLCRRKPELPEINSIIEQKPGIPLRIKKEIRGF
ncbi:MAG: NTP transferase domain-containing protein [Candidatus Scalindua sediminis]|nr:NTP transferase domain-containing protein [Candidatus Scalindua sediminis]